MLKTDNFVGYANDSSSIFHRRAIFPLVLFSIMEGIVLLAGMLLSVATNTWLAGGLVGHLLFTQPSGVLARTGTLLAPVLPATLYPVSSPAGVLVFIGMFAVSFLLYLLAVRYLPQYVSRRFILLTTLFLGCAYLLIPIVSSQDIFSYIAYARMGAIYHLNPLTTLPTAIRHDSIYPLVYWVEQPSAYGPVWAIITCALQWGALLSGLKSLLSIELLLRALGLCVHLGSTWLIWSLVGTLSGGVHKSGAAPSGHPQGVALLYTLTRRAASNIVGPPLAGGLEEQQRLRALLAFAWNPFLLIEACVNAHNDTIILFLVLLALWLLASHTESKQGRYLLAAVVLAFAACIKITLVVFLPGLLLFLWTRQVEGASIRKRFRAVVAATGVFAGAVILLYAPFWQHGAILHLLQVSPATTHDINSPYQFATYLFSSLKGIHIPTEFQPGTWVEALSHQVSMVLFAIVYAVICLRSLLAPRYVNTLPTLIRWMALVWLLYCIVGSPWFFPWYTITFFGLFALIEADAQTDSQKQSFFKRFHLAGFARLLAITMFAPISFGAWKPGNGIFFQLPGLAWLHLGEFVPFLPHFRWDYFNGLWIWAIPFLVLCYPPLPARIQKSLFKWRERHITA